MKRNSETTPSLTNVDMRLSRAFKPSDKAGLELILEVFNVFNHYNVTRVQNFQTPPPGAPAFGSPIVTSADNNRAIQVGVRFTVLDAAFPALPPALFPSAGPFRRAALRGRRRPRRLC